MILGTVTQICLRTLKGMCTNACMHEALMFCYKKFMFLRPFFFQVALFCSEQSIITDSYVKTISTDLTVVVKLNWHSKKFIFCTDL